MFIYTNQYVGGFLMAGSIPNHPEFDRSGPGLSGAAALARSATTTAGSGHIRGAESTLFGLR